MIVMFCECPECMGLGKVAIYRSGDHFEDRYHIYSRIPTIASCNLREGTGQVRQVVQQQYYRSKVCVLLAVVFTFVMFLLVVALLPNVS